MEFLVARRPRLLYVVLATRHDPSLGLHRLRLAGELTELRAADLRFTAKEARSCWMPRGSSCPTRPPPGSWHGPRGGLRACGSPRCRWLVTLIRSGSSPSSPAASGRLRTTCSPRSSSAAGRGQAAAAPHLDPGAGLRPARRPPRPARAARSGRSSSWRTRTRSSSRSTLSDRGSATTRCSRTCCSSSFGAASPMHRRAAPRRRRVARRARLRRRRDPACPGRQRLGARRGSARDHGLSLSLDGRSRRSGAAAAFPADALANPELAAFLAYVELTRTPSRRPPRTSRWLSAVPRRSSPNGGVTSACSRSPGWRSPAGAATRLGAPRSGAAAGTRRSGTVTELTLGNDARAVALMNLGIVELWSFRLTTPSDTSSRAWSSRG